MIILLKDLNHWLYVPLFFIPSALCITYASWFKNLIFFNLINNSFILSYSGVILVTIFFYKSKRYYNLEKKGTKLMSLIGRRSLDTYMIHYIFLPGLFARKDWLGNNSMTLFQLVVGISMTLVIVWFCLIVSKCSHSSTFISDWLFGIKERNFDIKK